jgi:redox-sensitive bicupin YhaK (pirin superfamily)
LYLDVHLPAGARFETDIPLTHNAFIYVYRGAARVNDTEIKAQRMGILSNSGQCVALDAASDTRLILIAGKPLNEPIVQYGPFVMNTQEQIHQALDDFRSGHFA